MDHGVIEKIYKKMARDWAFHSQQDLRTRSHGIDADNIPLQQMELGLL